MFLQVIILHHGLSVDSHAQAIRKRCRTCSTITDESTSRICRILHVECHGPSRRQIASITLRRKRRRGYWCRRWPIVSGHQGSLILRPRCVLLSFVQALHTPPPRRAYAWHLDPVFFSYLGFQSFGNIRSLLYRQGATVFESGRRVRSSSQCSLLFGDHDCCLGWVFLFCSRLFFIVKCSFVSSIIVYIGTPTVY